MSYWNVARLQKCVFVVVARPHLAQRVTHTWTKAETEYIPFACVLSTPADNRHHARVAHTGGPKKLRMVVSSLVVKQEIYGAIYQGQVF